MGLLTDPRAGTGKIIKLLLKWEKPLCLVLYVGGVIWLMLLALPAFNYSMCVFLLKFLQELKAYLGIILICVQANNLIFRYLFLRKCFITWTGYERE